MLCLLIISVSLWLFAGFGIWEANSRWSCYWGECRKYCYQPCYSCSCLWMQMPCGYPRWCCYREGIYGTSFQWAEFCDQWRSLTPAMTFKVYIIDLRGNLCIMDDLITARHIWVYLIVEMNKVPWKMMIMSCFQFSMLKPFLSLSLLHTCIYTDHTICNLVVR